MKKQLMLIGAIALIFSMSSCQKEKTKSAGVTKSESTKLKVNTAPSVPYWDLTLVPRNPGENYDTYYANFHGCNIYVIGPPIYDQAKYPTLVNGVPCFGQSMYSNAQGVIDYQNTGTDGNVFEVSQGHLSSTDYTSIRIDMNKYFQAQAEFNKPGSTSPQPSIFNFVKSNYPVASSGGFDLLIYVGKLIRVTTGTHWAVTEVNYPLPAPTPYTIPSTFINVPDPANSSIHYFLQGIKGLITSGNIAYLSGTTYTNGAAISVSGNYTQVAQGSGNFHSIGTIIRADNSTFRFDQTDNTN